MLIIWWIILVTRQLAVVCVTQDSAGSVYLFDQLMLWECMPFNKTRFWAPAAETVIDTTTLHLPCSMKCHLISPCWSLCLHWSLPLTALTMRYQEGSSQVCHPQRFTPPEIKFSPILWLEYPAFEKSSIGYLFLNDQIFNTLARWGVWT